MLDRIGVDQPRWRELTSMDDIQEFVEASTFSLASASRTSSSLGRVQLVRKL